MRHITTLTTRQLADSLAKAAEGGNPNLPPSADLVATVKDRLDRLVDDVIPNADKTSLLSTQAADLQTLYLANVRNGAYDNEPEPIRL